jgi:hypothetical protein
MADAIYDAATSGHWVELGALAQRQARAPFDVRVVCERFVHVLQENLPPSTETRHLPAVVACGR